ncbi:MAG: PTS sugar transporter subunit IIA [Lachnospiraceae bacterium]|nr:PTS sugar transporter subunit IIA [Lachnospiraceae bacterium]
MRITDLLRPEGIAIGVNPADKKEAIDRLIALHKKCGNLRNAEQFRDSIIKREKLGSTAIGIEIAIPHAKSRTVIRPTLTAITVPSGVDVDAPDGCLGNLIFMIDTPDEGDIHLEVLARMMQMLMDVEFIEQLKEAKSPQEFISIIDHKESGKHPSDHDHIKGRPVSKQDSRDMADKVSRRSKVLAVTACPTGIAHTYMAAETLSKTADMMGVSIKCETNGAAGAKNVLTEQEIRDCDGIIIAADKAVETARFDGKPVYFTKVSDGIHKPKELIETIIDGKAPIFHSDVTVRPAETHDNETPGRRFYKHLMNGVSHMLPFVVAGGIFIAISFLIDTAAGVEPIGNASFGSVTSVAAWFNAFGGYAFGLMLPMLAGFIAFSLADRPGFLVGFVGGVLAANGATLSDPLAVSTVPSGFLGALFAGFCGGWLMNHFKKLCAKLPDTFIPDGIKPLLLYPIAGLGMVGIMMSAVNPVMGAINQLLNNGLLFLNNHNLGVLMACILAGMMSIDMGGPFNKTAYIFGTGMLTVAAASTDAAVQQSCYQVMAAVMIGGMVPPITIALSTTFFKGLWTAEERKSSLANYIMGLSFITEGAIPYAASHPLQVLPSCILGSAVAGGLSWMFRCTLMAPHGGIFVIACIGNPVLYLIALAIGSIVGMLVLTALKKAAKDPADTDGL